MSSRVAVSPGRMVARVAWMVRVRTKSVSSSCSVRTRSKAKARRSTTFVLTGIRHWRIIETGWSG